jgi:hypothetical protein
MAEAEAEAAKVEPEQTAESGAAVLAAATQVSTESLEPLIPAAVVAPDTIPVERVALAVQVLSLLGI